MKRIVLFVFFMGVACVQTAFAQQANVQLKEVVVTATKTEKASQDLTQSVTVLTGEEIKKLGATNVSEAVRTVTGVAVSDQGPTGALTTATIRGANYSQVLVLVDGIRMNSPRDGGVDLSALPVSMDDIDRIEVVRGPGSALYGADAVGGVVNIITKQPGASPVNRISGAIGSHGYDTVQVNTSGRQGVSRYMFSAERETSDGYRTNSGLEQWTFGGRVGFDLSKSTALDLTANYISKENGMPGNLQYYETPEARQGQRTLVTGGALKGRLNKEVDYKVSASLTEDMLRALDPQPHIATFGLFTFLIPPYSSQHESKSQRSEVQANWVPAPWSIFTLGYELRRDNLDSTDSGNHTTTNHAWYLQDEIPLGETIIFVLGERYDSHSVYGGQWSSRMSGRYRAKGSGTIVRLSYGESFRGPTLNDLYWNSPDAVGNPNLRPEQAKEYEFAVEQPFSGGSLFRAALFERKVTDLINWNFMVYPAVPENIGKADIKGVEAEADLRLSSAARFSLNYTYLNPMDEVMQTKIYSTIMPKNQIKGTFSLSIDKDVYVTVSGRAVENYVQPGSPEWKYSVYDAKIAQKYGKAGGANAEIYFAMTNIFDRSYENIQGYPMPPREIRGGVTIQY